MFMLLDGTPSPTASTATAEHVHEALVKEVEMMSQLVLDGAMLLAAVAVLTVSLIELVKGIYPFRRQFHQRQLAGWLPSTAHRQLEVLLGGDSGLKALCALHRGEFIAGLRGVCNIVVESPASGSDLFEFLTGENAKTSLDLREVHRLKRLANLKIDVLERKIQRRWALANQLVSVSAASVLLFFLIGTLENGLVSSPIRLVVSVAGGMIAPLAKDLVAALSGLRARRAEPELSAG